MLEIRPCCEHCGKALPNHSREAMICSFECTYCQTCAMKIFKNVCPSCGGNFCERPVRPMQWLKQNPASTEQVFDPKDMQKALIKVQELENIPPENR